MRATLNDIFRAGILEMGTTKALVIGIYQASWKYLNHVMRHMA